MAPTRRAPYLAIVRRGHPEVFRVLKEAFEGEAVIEVIWDRRVERRRMTKRPVETERRVRDRRQRRMPDTWDTLGLILVRRDARPSS